MHTQHSPRLQTRSRNAALPNLRLKKESLWRRKEKKLIVSLHFKLKKNTFTISRNIINFYIAVCSYRLLFMVSRFCSRKAILHLCFLTIAQTVLTSLYFGGRNGSLSSIDIHLFRYYCFSLEKNACCYYSYC